MNTTQTQTRKYPKKKAPKTTGEGEAQGGGVQPSRGSVAWAAGKSTCWRLSNTYRHTDSTDTAEAQILTGSLS